MRRWLAIRAFRFSIWLHPAETEIQATHYLVQLRSIRAAERFAQRLMAGIAPIAEAVVKFMETI